MKNIFYGFLLVLILMVGSTACALVGIVVSPLQTFEEPFVIQLGSPVPPADFVNGSIEVGKRFRYEFAGVDPTTNEVVLKLEDTSMTALYGKITTIVVRIQRPDNGMSIQGLARVAGNFDTAKQSMMFKIAADYKGDLERQFAQYLPKSGKK